MRVFNGAGGRSPSGSNPHSGISRSVVVVLETSIGIERRGGHEVFFLATPIMLANSVAAPLVVMVVKIGRASNKAMWRLHLVVAIYAYRSPNSPYPGPNE
jgi:hypothetical protein